MKTIKAVAGAALAGVALCLAPIATSQTTMGSDTVIVVPVVADTSSFKSEVTVYNPNPTGINVSVLFYEANNSGTPGAKPCSPLLVPANRSVQFVPNSQCTLSPGANHFGLLLLAEQTYARPFYGYVRTQTSAGQGFSTEGFPVDNFTSQTSHVTGLKRQAAFPGYQANCFAGSLDGSVAFTLKLFSDATGTQLGSAITGGLNAFEQMRYLDVFAQVGAPAGDWSNVRAEFALTSGGPLIGFCTVQDNTSLGADFRIAKTLTPLLPATDRIPPAIEITAPAIASAYSTTYSVAYSDNVELAYSVAPPWGDSSFFPPGSRSAVKNYTAAIPLGSTFNEMVVAADTSGNVSKKLVRISTPSTAIPFGTYIPVGNPTMPENFDCVPPPPPPVPGSSLNNGAIREVSVRVDTSGTQWDSTGYFGCVRVDVASRWHSGTENFAFCTSSTVPFSATRLTAPHSISVWKSGYDYSYEWGFDGQIRLISSTPPRLEVDARMNCRINYGEWTTGAMTTFTVEMAP